MLGGGEGGQRPDARQVHRVTVATGWWRRTRPGRRRASGAVATGDLAPAARHREERERVVHVLLVLPEAVARVVQHRQVRGLVRRAVAGVGHQVADLAHHPGALLVDDRPAHRERRHRAAGEGPHRPGHPGADLVAALEAAERVLDVRRVLGEHVREPRPVTGAGRGDHPVLVALEGALDLGAGGPGHTASSAGASSGRNKGTIQVPFARYARGCGRGAGKPAPKSLTMLHAFTSVNLNRAARPPDTFV